MLFRRARGLLLFATMVLATGGCTRGNRVEVEGQVTLDGAPLEQGTITFVPASGQGPTAGGAIVAGAYKAPTPPGRMKVSIQGFKQTGTIKGKPGTPEEGMETPIKTQIVAPRFNEKTELTADVDGANRHFDFKVESQ